MVYTIYASGGDNGARFSGGFVGGVVAVLMVGYTTCAGWWMMDDG